MNKKNMFFIVGIVILFLLFVGSSVIIINANNRIIEKIILKTSKNTLNYIDSASYSSLLSYSNYEDAIISRLRDNCKVIEMLIEKELLTNKLLHDMVKQNNLFFIRVYDRDHELVNYSKYYIKKQRKKSAEKNKFWSVLFTDNQKEAILGFSENRFTNRKRFGYAYKTISDLVIVISIEADYMYDFRKESELQNLFDEIYAHDNIAFVFLEDSDKIVVSANKSNLSKNDYSKILYKAKQSEYFPLKDKNKNDIFVISKNLKKYKTVRLFLGLHLDEYNIIKRNSLIYNIVYGLVLFVIVGFLMVLFLKLQKTFIEKISMSEKIEYLSKMSSGIAHEIRNPLNSISMFIQRLEIELYPSETGEKSELHTISSVIQKEIIRLNKIVEDFITLNRPFTPDFQYENISSIIKEVILIAKNEFYNVDIKFNIVEDICYMTDQEKFKIVLYNILKNACQSVDNNNNGLVIIEHALIKEELIIKISDNGVGIASSDIDRVFTPYYTTKTNGTGLGLAITKSIVRVLGGKIEISSTIGQGTKIKLSFNSKFVKLVS